MDSLLSTLVSGAVAAVQPTVTEAVKDAYAALRNAMIRLRSGLKRPIEALETNPTDAAAAKALAEHIPASDAEQFAAVHDLEDKLRKLLDSEWPGVVAAVKVDIARLSAGRDIRVEGEGIHATGESWEAGEDAVFIASKKKL